MDLVQYYHCLSKRENSPILPSGYSKVGINFHLILTKEGEIKEILPYTRTEIRGKKEIEVPKEEVFPWRYSVSATSSETIEHRDKYTFGLLWDKDSSGFVPSLDAFEKNKEKNLLFLEDLSSPVVDAYVLFLKNWTPSEELSNPHLLKLGKDFIGSKYVISLEDSADFLHKDPKTKEKWDKFWSESKEDEDSVYGQCAISGKKSPLARTHTKLKGVGGQASGVGLVSFNEEAYESYGKKQSFNSSISQEVMEQYTETFNFLANDPQHKQMLDDMTLLFWAMTTGDESPMLEEAQDWFGFPVNTEEKNEKKAEESLQSAVTATALGRSARIEALKEYESVEFYILGVKPNTSRLSVKFFMKNNFGQFQENIALHQKHCAFTEQDKAMSLKWILSVLKSPVAPEDAPPDLQTKLLHSILTGSKYTDYLLHHLIYRVKVDKDKEEKGKPKFTAISRPRVRLIRACLIRKNIIKWEDTTMLQQENADTAYLCGRLFAILEEIQRKAQGKEVNATIKDKFFSSACTTPSLVFPRLLKLSQNHLHKIENRGTAVNFDKKLTEVMGAMTVSFPRNLNMDKQGLFILGYYQEKNAYFQGKEKNESEEG